MELTSVVLVDMPAMLRAIVENAVAAEPDLELVGEFADQGAALERIERSEDVVVVTRVDRARVHSLLSARPSWRVLTLSTDGHSVLYERPTPPRMLADLSPETLRAVLLHRGGGGSDGGE